MTMAWPETRVKDWNEFQTLASRFAETRSATQFSYVFRGQTDARWPLKPTLHRVLKEDTSAVVALDIERRIHLEFFSQAHLHVPPSLLNPGMPNVSPSGKLNLLYEQWALMRHYGVPTRILDWTGSPYVGAYFAVQDRWDSDGVIWLLQGHTLLTQMLL